MVIRHIQARAKNMSMRREERGGREGQGGRERVKEGGREGGNREGNGGKE